jgi:hypothetical protein
MKENMEERGTERILGSSDKCVRGQWGLEQF